MMSCSEVLDKGGAFEVKLDGVFSWLSSQRNGERIALCIGCIFQDLDHSIIKGKWSFSCLVLCHCPKCQFDSTSMHAGNTSHASYIWSTKAASLV